VKATERKNPLYLDTLAAALALAGRFDEAVAVQKEAVALLDGSTRQVEYAGRVDLYEAGYPYFDYDELAGIRRAQDNLEAAEALFELELRNRRIMYGRDSAKAARTLVGLGGVL